MCELFVNACYFAECVSALGGELCLDVHSADGTLPTGGQPLIHTRLMEQMHTG